MQTRAGEENACTNALLSRSMLSLGRCLLPSRGCCFVLLVARNFISRTQLHREPPKRPPWLWHGILFEEPNPTGSRPRDLIGRYKTTETPQEGTNSRKWTESTGSFLSMNEMQKGGEIPEGGAKDETENVSSIENVSSEKRGGREREGKN